MMTNDELQGVVPDPNPFINCDDCGEGYHYEDYWEPRYVEPDDVNHSEATWRCDECQRIQDRKGSNHSLERFVQGADR